jgi:hypothetical protein
MLRGVMRQPRAPELRRHASASRWHSSRWGITSRVLGPDAPLVDFGPDLNGLASNGIANLPSFARLRPVQLGQLRLLWRMSIRPAANPVDLSEIQPDFFERGRPSSHHLPEAASSAVTLVVSLHRRGRTGAHRRHRMPIPDLRGKFEVIKLEYAERNNGAKLLNKHIAAMVGVTEPLVTGWLKSSSIPPHQVVRLIVALQRHSRSHRFL